MTQVSRRTAVAVVAATIAVAAWIGVQRYRALRAERASLGAAPSAAEPLRVPLWLQPGAVRHHGRFAFLWDGPEPLARFRQAEGLDAVIAGSGSDEELARKLMRWTRAQFEPGKPSPYPPPDAITTLAEIRGGRTGGFCAQYAFVLVQALQSFGRPARLVTIAGHEVVETWLPDQARWTLLDPMFDLQVVDRSDRSLSALEIREAGTSGAELAITEGNRLDETAAAYLARYARIAIWTRNAFTSAPVNFADFDRYRVWLAAADGAGSPPESLSTSHAEDLYGPPDRFPGAL